MLRSNESLTRSSNSVSMNLENDSRLNRRGAAIIEDILRNNYFKIMLRYSISVYMKVYVL